jgi:hypothetical protein
VVVEVYLLRCHPGGALAYRCATGQLGVSETPDEAALRIGRIASDGPGPAVAVHSTSWRHLGDGSIVLAYVVAPDPVPGAAAVPILSFDVPHGPCASRPSTVLLQREQIAAHAAGTWPWSPTKIPTCTKCSPDARSWPGPWQRWRRHPQASSPAEQASVRSPSAVRG